MAFTDNLPIGYRFLPTDEELLCHYLMRKNLGLNEPICIIPEVDICSWEPEELRGKFTESSFVQLKDSELWFFCEQKPGRTHRRSTKGGYWKKTGDTRDVKSRHGTKKVIGSKKILTFFHGNSSTNTKTDWVMHEYHLPNNALDGFLHGNRKNYILCKIRCNSDEMANSSPSYEIGQDEPISMDIAGIFEQEADNGFIPEHLVQARMRWLEQDCWTEDCWMPDDRGNLNPQPILSQFPEHSNSSPESSRTQFSFGRDSIEMDSSFSGIGDIDIFNIFDQDNVYETPRLHQQNVVIMENKQTQKVESLPAYLPIDEKKGIVEDNSAQTSASSLRMDTPAVKYKRESRKVVLPASSEAVAVKQAPHKIKEEMVSASSSSASIRKPRAPVTATRLERHTAAATTKKKEINTMAALSGYGKPARELKPVTTTMEPRSHSSTCIQRKCCCSDQSMVYFQDTLVVLGIFLVIAIFYGIFNKILGVFSRYPYGCGRCFGHSNLLWNF